MNNIIDYKKIGERIKLARKNKGCTQAQICNDLNISLYHFSKIENAHVSASLETLVEIANYLDISIDYLLSGISKLDQNYYNDELVQILSNCNNNQKKLILEMAKLIANTEITNIRIK